MTEEQKRNLEEQLWKIANDLRGHMSGDEFRDYILGFIFYKYLSENLIIHADKMLEPDGKTFLGLDESDPADREYLEALEQECVGAPDGSSDGALGYFLKPSEVFSVIAKKSAEPGAFVLEDLTRILNSVQQSTMGTNSEDDFDNLFEDLDLTSTKLGRTNEARNKLISKVLVHLDGIDFRLDDVEADVLGDAYEYLIGQFASGAGKKSGEFYTPQQVSTILARIVAAGKTRLRSAYDPTCGSGSLLLRVAKQVAGVGDFYGQELNRTTYNLARMNMILHGVHYRDFDIRQENTLEHPQHLDKRFEAIIANPPFSANWSAAKMFESDDRFAEYGALAPSKTADYAFIQHMLHHLDEDGTAAVVLPHGVLFRGNKEGKIREHIIKKGWLDAVIGLPANIFYGTQIPTCIMVFKKCRSTDDVLFVDASECYVKGKNQNSLSGGNIEKIVATFEGRVEEDRFSRRVPFTEIEGNGFNLNIPRYIDTFEPEPEVDLAAVTADLKRIEQDMGAVDAEIRAFCAELGLEAPV